MWDQLCIEEKVDYIEDVLDDEIELDNFKEKFELDDKVSIKEILKNLTQEQMDYFQKKYDAELEPEYVDEEM